MKALMLRVLYKYYLVGITFAIYTGLILISALEWMTDDQQWGWFLILAGISLLISERKFIRGCNEDFIDCLKVKEVENKSYEWATLTRGRK